MPKSKIFNLIALSALTVSVAACSIFSGSETSGQYVDDTTITSKVKTRIVEEPTLRSKAIQIHVETMHGVVQLSGFVNSQSAKDTADTIAGQVPGVRSVKDDIIVRTNKSY